MTAEEIISDAILKVSEKAHRPSIIEGTASEIDKAKQTCTVKREGEADLIGVRLATVVGEDGQAITIVPVDASVVHVALLEHSKSKARIVSCQKIDEVLVVVKKMSIKADEITVACEKITFNNGNLGGMAIVEKIQNNIDALKSYCTAMKSAISTGISTVGESSSASGKAGAAAFDGAMAAQSISFKSMNNDKIKH